jgi:hypothetical protein
MNKAYCDLVYLLDQGYPKKSALTFVGNHYTLDNNQRNVLYRAAIPLKDVKTIQGHLIHDYLILNTKVFYVDTYNQLITFFSLINQEAVIICRDGVLRDIFSSIHVDKDLQITSDLIYQYLTVLLKLKPKKVKFFLDAKKSYSKKHASLISNTLPSFDIPGDCIVDNAVDWHLKEQIGGVTFSHDSAIIKVAPYCFDLFLWVIESNFLPMRSDDTILNFKEIICTR